MHYDESLRHLFEPSGVAVIGASTNVNKLGYGIARSLNECGYTGVVHYVNPGEGTLFGESIYPDVASVPDPVDLAVLLIPSHLIPKELLACADRGIRVVIIVSGGFKEIGADGAALEDEVLQIAKENDIRVLGPNCIGIIDTHLPIDTSFLPPPKPLPGDIAFLSQSGALCAAVIDWTRTRGIGFSQLISLGNQVDISEADVLAPVASNPHTRVVTMYLEGVKDGRRFLEEAARISATTPLVAVKAGRFESGKKAIISHTGALTGNDEAFTAAFNRCGVARAETIEEMFDWARALAWCPPLSGDDIAILTNAGGPGVTAADAIESRGLSLAEFSMHTVDALKDLLPPVASLHNPVDMLASASPQQYAECLKVLLDDDGVNGVMLILPPPPMFKVESVVAEILPVVEAADKPILIALMGGSLIQNGWESLRSARIPDYRFPERAASAMAALSYRGKYLKRASQKPLTRTDVDKQTVHKLLGRICAEMDSPGFIPEIMVNEILHAYRIPTLELSLAQDAHHAVALANRIGHPVALKVASPDISHKSEVGGILLNLNDDKSVAEGFGTLIDNLENIRPEARIHGVYVQRMSLAGQEVILGAIRDAQFGPMVMFGSGGVEVEGLKDVGFALAPLTEHDAEAIINTTWAGRKLEGFRHIPRADRGAVYNALIYLAQLLVDFPQIEEVDVNPFSVYRDGQGAVAVDARIKVNPHRSAAIR